jgi:hypothetical protein
MAQALQHHQQTVEMVTTTNKQALTYQPYSLQQEHAQVVHQDIPPLVAVAVVVVQEVQPSLTQVTGKDVGCQAQVVVVVLLTAQVVRKV